jgi:predicted porin
MKKSLVALAVLGSLASVAQADPLDGNSVVLYGVLDGGLRYTTHADANGGGRFQVGNGAESESYFGLKGSEDLGRGLHAIFDVEGGFSLGSGNSVTDNRNDGRLFGRQAYVGLQSDQYGTLTLGRQNTLGYDFIVNTNPYGEGNVPEVQGSQYYLSGPRWDNSVKYQGTFNNVYVGAMYGSGNQAGSFATDRGWGVAGGYTYNPLNIRAFYQEANDANFGVIGVAPNDKQKMLGVGATYTFGPAEVFAQYFNNRYSVTRLTDNIYNVGASYQFTPVVALKGGVTYDNQSSADSGHRLTYSLLSSYNLSKRTDVYAEADYTQLSGGYFDPTYDFNNTSNTYSNRLGVSLGLRHKF